MNKAKAILKVAWLFYSYVFIPQRRPKDDSAAGWTDEATALAGGWSVWGAE